MRTRRFTGLRNEFSKKAENRAHAVALHMIYYNFLRIYQSLRTAPAMAANVTKRLWEMGDVVDVVEDKGGLHLRHGLFIALPTVRDVNVTPSGLGGYGL
jgi:hypothetical protein